MEEYCRDLVDQGNELYIFMGNYGKGGYGDFGFEETLADGLITVPASIWKVILVLDKGGDDLSRIHSETRIIAVDIENDDDLGDINWGDYRISIDELENRTGFDFLSNLEVGLQENLESIVDDGPVN